MHHLRSSTLLASFLALFALACSDSSSSGGGGETPADDMGVGPVGDAAPPAADMGGGGPLPPGARELQIVGERRLLVPLSSMSTLTVRYVDANGGVPNARISFTQADGDGMPAPGGVEGSGLSSLNTTTDANGQATVSFVAGPRPVSMRVTASAEGAAPVTWEIAVATPGTGGLSVTVNYDTMTGRYDYPQIARARVDLFTGQTCEQLRLSATNLLGAQFSANIEPYDEVDKSATLGDLGTETVTVTGVLQNANNAVVAFGCQEGVTIDEGMLKEVAVDATDLPLEFKGRYTVVSAFDLTALLEQSENETLNRVADVLEVVRVLGNGDGERGMAVVQLFCDLITDNDTLCTIAERIGGPIVDNVFENNAPRALLDVLTVLSDLVEIAGNLTIVGEMEFVASYPTPEGLLPGNENRWQKLRFDWNNGCPPGEMCTREFTFGDLEVDRRPVAGPFDGQIEGVRMNISEHSMTLHYGSILLGLATQWLIPAITGTDGPVTVEEVLDTLIPCEPINDAVGDPDSGLCEDVLVAALSDILIEQIGNLTFDGDGAFRLNGSMEPQDADGDLVVDTLALGVWTANISFGGSPTVIDGCFTGCRPGGDGTPCTPAPCTIGAPVDGGQ